MSQKRIVRELNNLQTCLPSSITANPVNKDNIYNWSATIAGPPKSPYDGGIFSLKIQFPGDYPFMPPKIKFLTKIYHPNIDKSGDFCCTCEKSIFRRRWSPLLSVSELLLQIQQLLKEPDFNSCTNLEVVNDCGMDREEYEDIARAWTKNYAMPQQQKKRLFISIG